MRHVDLIDREPALTKMKSRKAPGPDSINPELAKKGWTASGTSTRRLVQCLPQTHSLPENMEERLSQVSPHIDCPRNFYLIIKDYLTKRVVMMEDCYYIMERQAKRGFPQLSILGPKFWNLIMDGLL